VNINTYKEDSKAIPPLIPLGIAMDYQVKWNMHRILRDFIQNFYDSIRRRVGEENNEKFQFFNANQGEL
jgi:hypothetical protein